MQLDITLLQILKHRKEYEKLRRSLNPRTLDPATIAIAADFGKFFEAVPECEVIPIEGAFMSWFNTAHPTLTQEQVAHYRLMLAQCSREPDEQVKSAMMYNMLTADMATLLQDGLDRYVRGEEVDLSALLRGTLDNFDTNVQRKVRVPFVDMDQDLFADDVNNTGFKWRLECLNRVMRPLRPGDFGIVAARPDKGKTTFFTSELTHMAAQLEDVYGPNHGRTILWFNNEGPGKRIVKRLVQSALALPTSGLVELVNNGTMWTEYERAINAHRSVIRVLDVHGFKSWQVEEVIRQVKPALIVFDMIDNVHFGGEVGNGGTRTDQLLEAMYQWGREIGVRYDTPVLATSQVSGDGDGLAYPTLSMLKDSKTGKQGAADFIITLGAKNEALFENTRFIGLTKNKLHREGGPKSPNAEVVLDGVCGRLIEGATA